MRDYNLFLVVVVWVEGRGEVGVGFALIGKGWGQSHWNLFLTRHYFLIWLYAILTNIRNI